MMIELPFDDKATAEEVWQIGKKKKHKRKKKVKKPEDVCFEPFTIESDFFGEAFNVAPEDIDPFSDFPAWNPDDTLMYHNGSPRNGAFVGGENFSSPIPKEIIKAGISGRNDLFEQVTWDIRDGPAFPFTFPEHDPRCFNTQVRDTASSGSEESIHRIPKHGKSQSTHKKKASLGTFLEKQKSSQCSNNNSVASLMDSWNDYLDCSVLSRSVSSEQRNQSLREELSLIRTLIANARERQDQQWAPWKNKEGAA